VNFAVENRSFHLQQFSVIIFKNFFCTLARVADEGITNGV
jgi:hypothetical protein